MFKFEFWRKYLLVVSTVFVVLGVLLALFGTTPPFKVMNESISNVFWDVPDLPVFFVYYQRWVYGVIGATMAGWGIVFLFITKYALPKKEPWVWNCFVYSITLWFVLDTGISLHYNVSFNVLLNSVMFVAMFIPMVAIRTEFGVK